MDTAGVVHRWIPVDLQGHEQIPVRQRESVTCEPQPPGLSTTWPFDRLAFRPLGFQPSASASQKKFNFSRLFKPFGGLAKTPFGLQRGNLPR